MIFVALFAAFAAGLASGALIMSASHVGNNTASNDPYSLHADECGAVEGARPLNKGEGN